MTDFDTKAVIRDIILARTWLFPLMLEANVFDRLVIPVLYQISIDIKVSALLEIPLMHQRYLKNNFTRGSAFPRHLVFKLRGRDFCNMCDADCFRAVLISLSSS